MLKATKPIGMGMLLRDRTASRSQQNPPDSDPGYKD